MADRWTDWERERRRQEALEREDDRGGWTDPVVRGPVPEDPRWREDERRFGHDRGDQPWEGRDERFSRPRGGGRYGRRGAYTGWGYQGDENRPRRTYWYGREDPWPEEWREDPRLEANQAGGDWRRPDPTPHLERTFGPGGHDTDPGDASLRRLSAFRVAPGPHAGKGPRGYRRDWARVREDLCDMLERDGEVDATDIEVEVHEGVVTLRGTVSDRHQKRRAEHLIDTIPQIRDVHNELRLRRHEERHGLTVNGTDHGVRPTETH
jgi:hypothetical protein